MPSDLCKRCVHTKVCFNDKNLFGDVFIAGNPMFFDNRELFKKYEERKAKGFPCDNFLEVVRCEDCKHRIIESNDDWCECTGCDINPDGFCEKGERREDAQPEHTMEEFMYGQDMGNPEDGSL